MAGLLASGVELKVEPEQLIAKSQLVENRINQVTMHFESLKVMVEKSQGYWKGEAGERYRKLYQEQETTVEMVLKRLLEHPADLRKIAETYIMAETSVQQLIQSLPGDVLL